MKLLGIILLIIFTGSLSAQEKKSVAAKYIDTPLNIDGVLDEPAYSGAQPARDFVQLAPYNGKPSMQPSEVYIFYDQTAIYIGGMFYDSAPDSIFNFITARDNTGMSDYFGVYIDPYNQGQLAYGFFITPAGVQMDLKAIKTSFDYEDGSWDAVWQSKARVTDKGWSMEMKIPYSAIRFPENGGGTWGINMFRNIRRYNSNNSWNYINREVAGFIHQEGQLTGIQNIKPPVRLALSPYAAAYTEFKDGTSSPDFTYKGGMDLKYGISESFTLDMMLVPDFGQIQSDDKQLNLTPYELYYSEKRQFFTEGTELFDRAGIFYSRRIGTNPKFSDRADNALSDQEKVDYNPNETQLLNATKISGRTTKGWGIGFLNAMTLPSYATLKDTITGKKHDVLIQPFTNYNVAVVDKSLKNNSYVSLINSSMLMANDPFYANVTATDFQIRNKGKTFAVSGKGGVSTRNDGGDQTGYFANLALDKNSGKLQYGISHVMYSDKYNPNDLGYLRRNNNMITETYINYNIINPFWIFRETHATLWWDHNRVYRPSAVFENAVGINNYNQFKNNYQLEMNLQFHSTNHDYYEPRVSGWYYTEPYYVQGSIWMSTDQRKAIFANGGYTYANQPNTDQSYHNSNFYLNFRIGRRLNLNYSASYEYQVNDRGWVDVSENEDSIFFAKRNVKTLQNIIGASFTFNNKAGINFRMRHYWSGAGNKDFYLLQPNGTLQEDPAYQQNKDENYNAFNIDVVFRWIFAPGSEFSLAWKNSILNSNDKVVTNYWDNLDRTWKSDQINSFSFKILYYIDYNTLRKKRDKS